MPNLLSDYHAAIPDLSVEWQAEPAPAPHLLAVNRGLAEAIGLDLSGQDDAALTQLFTGQGWAKNEGASPVALAYSGHQFGHFSPVLGDGRALLLGESKAPDGTLYDVQLKGSGRTPFSRNGDGKAALGPVLREFLVAEAMHALGVPTTRALAAVATGERVQREAGLPGAILTRVAASHIRIGTFEYLAARRDIANLNTLIDYTLARHYPDGIGEDKGMTLLTAYAARLAELIAHWMSLGFVHGVMNTDNMALSGETIDYGPCAFIDHFNPAAVFSSIDKQGRYAFGNQPVIAQWNLARLAESILTTRLGEGEATDADIAPLAEIVKGFMPLFEAAFARRMAAKLGLAAPDADLTAALWTAMAGQNVDFTGFFRALSDDVRGVAGSGAAHFTDPQIFESWASHWRAKLAEEGRDPAAVADAMDAVNPLYIPRNHKVEEALAAAHEGDLGPWRMLLDLVTHPFTAKPDMESYARPAPDNFGPYKTFCGT